MSLLYDGKSKSLYSTGSVNELTMTFKDEMRAADGRCAEMPGKGLILTEICAKIFDFLKKHGVPCHYLSRSGSESLLVTPLQMLPFECVVRRFADGTFFLRNPQMNYRQRFAEPVFEIFLKNDSLNDPIVVWDETQDTAKTHHSNVPVGSSTLIGEISVQELIPGCSFSDFHRIWCEVRDLSLTIFNLLERKFAEQEGILCDFKIEFGRSHGKVVLGDSIEPDAWRLWHRGIGVGLDRDCAYSEAFTPKIMDVLTSRYLAARMFIDRVFA